MLRKHIQICRWLAGAVLLVPLPLGPQAHSAQSGAEGGDAVQVVGITATRYHFSPSSIHVRKGARVQLKVVALDHAHGFRINVYPDKSGRKGVPGLVFSAAPECWKIAKGQTAVIEFVAQQEGSYPFTCCNVCGFGHLGMRGVVLVDP